MAIAVLDELVEHDLKVTPVDDEHPIEALPTDSADERSAKTLAGEVRTGVRITRTPSEWKAPFGLRRQRSGRA